MADTGKIVALINALAGEKVNELKSAITQEKAPVILDNATGEIVTIPDGADGMKVETLTVAIEPIQDLHGQANPYPGGGGKNKFNGADVSTTHTNNWGVTWDSTTNTLSVEHKNSYSTGTPVCDLTLAVGTYVVSGTFGGGISLYVNGTYSTTLVSGNTFTVESGSTYRIGFPNNEASTLTYKNVQIEAGSTASAFAPYSNICPISGWSAAEVTRTGKNHCPATEWEKGQYLSGIWASYDSRQTSPFIPIIPETEYCMSVDTSNAADIAWINYNYFDENETWLGSRSENGDSAFSGEKSHSFTIHNKSAKYVRLTVRAYSDANKDITGVSMATAKPQLEFGSSATAYTPFVDSDTYTYTFPSPTPGTVYGGTLTVNSDGTGSLVVDRANVDISTLDFTPSTAENHVFRTDSLKNVADLPDTDSDLAKAICSVFGQMAFGPISASDNGKFAIASKVATYRGRIVFIDHRYSTVNDFIQGNTGTQLVYELATPVVYNLTALEVITLLKGTNNLWADCGNTSIEYPCDTKLYVDKKIMEAIANALNA